MSHLVSVLLEHLNFFDPGIGGLHTHGANLTISTLVRYFAVDPNAEALEVFLHPQDMLDTAGLDRAARLALPPAMRGKGRLRFYPRHSLPEIWGDGQPRILFCVDPEWLPRDRYLRDRFAVGPMPIISDTHAMGHHRLWVSLSRYAAASPVAYDSIACLSRACQEVVRRAFQGFINPVDTPLPCRLDLMPHGVDTTLFYPRSEASRQETRRLLGLPLEGQITLCLGRLTPYSKADLLPLLHCFAEASTREDDYLLIAGVENMAGYGQKLLEAAAGLGLADRVHLHLNVDMAMRPLYYAAADLSVFPSDNIQETLGNVALEAMASGIPLIASDWDGIRDLVRDGETGFLIPTYMMPGLDRVSAFSPATAMMTDYLYTSQSVWVDTRALTEALRTLLDVPAQRLAMGQSARLHMEQNYAWPIILERWRALWDELATHAALETPEDRERRRAGATRLGLPTPYVSLFAPYATAVLDPETCYLCLSAAGRAVAADEAHLQFYDETLPMLHQEVINLIFERLSRLGAPGMRMAELTQSIAAQAKYLEDDVRFHLGLLLKRDMLEVSLS